MNAIEKDDLVHQCTKCASVFPSDFEELLKGCPNCENKLFKLIVKKPLALTIPLKRKTSAWEEIKVDPKDESTEFIPKEGPNESSNDSKTVEGVKIIEPGVYELDINNLIKDDAVVLLQAEGVFRIALPSSE